MVHSLIHNAKLRKKADQAGVAVATACGVHCLCFPLLLALPGIQGLVRCLSEPAEKLFLGCSFLLGTFNLLHSYRTKHHRPECLAVFGAGLLMMAFRDRISIGGVEWLAGLSGGMLVAAAHLRNLQLCRVRPCCGDEHCPR